MVRDRAWIGALRVASGDAEMRPLTEGTPNPMTETLSVNNRRSAAMQIARGKCELQIGPGRTWNMNDRRDDLCARAMVDGRAMRRAEWVKSPTVERHPRAAVRPRAEMLCRIEGVTDRFALTFDDGPSRRHTV